MIIEGTIEREVNLGTEEEPTWRKVTIPFQVDAERGTYSQWGHDTMVLGENVDLLEALRDVAVEHSDESPEEPDR